MPKAPAKTQLAQELAAQLRQRALRAVAVPESLRAWCAAGRTRARPEEQLAIAREQEDAVDAAACDADFVVADTTAPMVAIYAGMLHPDGELLRFALGRQQAYGATLVTGLTCPGSPTAGTATPASRARGRRCAGAQSPAWRRPRPSRWCSGQGPQRLDSALQALDAAGVLPAGIVRRTRESDAAQAWTWVCDKCSDPACEHRLFTRLRESR